jgi:hypothetical protein
MCKFILTVDYVYPFFYICIMKKKLWVFGCSFSSGYHEVTREFTYGNLLAHELGYEINNLSDPGQSNDKILYDLINNLKNIETGDLILFQFSLFNRIGFFINDQNYFTTSGLVEVGLDNKINNPQPLNENFYTFTSRKNLETLLDYTKYWHRYRSKFDYDNSLNILNFLRVEKNVDFVVLNMGEWVTTKDSLIMPISENPNNNSMLKFMVHSKLTVSDEFPENHKKYYDTHPGFKAHKQIKDLLVIKLGSLNDK